METVPEPTPPQQPAQPRPAKPLSKAKQTKLQRERFLAESSTPELIELFLKGTIAGSFAAVWIGSAGDEVEYYTVYGPGSRMIWPCVDTARAFLKGQSLIPGAEPLADCDVLAALRLRCVALGGCVLMASKRLGAFKHGAIAPWLHYRLAEKYDEVYPEKKAEPDPLYIRDLDTDPGDWWKPKGGEA